MTDVERQGKLVQIVPNSQSFYHYFDTGLAIAPAEWISDVFSIEINNNMRLGEAETLALPVCGYFLDWAVSDPTPGAGTAFIRIRPQIGLPLAGPPVTWHNLTTLGPTPNAPYMTTADTRSAVPAMPYVRFRVVNEGTATSAPFVFFWSFRTV